MMAYTSELSLLSWIGTSRLHLNWVWAGPGEVREMALVLSPVFYKDPRGVFYEFSGLWLPLPFRVEIGGPLEVSQQELDPGAVAYLLGTRMAGGWEGAEASPRRIPVRTKSRYKGP